MISALSDPALAAPKKLMTVDEYWDFVNLPENDNKFLELAITGRASHIISGDHDLLSLSPFKGITVLTPPEFLERFR